MDPKERERAELEAMRVERIERIYGGTVTNQAQCRGCQKPIYWLKRIKDGREQRIPVNPDGERHFNTCPNADDFRQAAQERPERECFECHEHSRAKGYECYYCHEWLCDGDCLEEHKMNCTARLFPD